MENFPPEILRHILDDLSLSSLKVLRLCWRFLEPFILPRLFHTIKVNFAEKHTKRLQGIALSPHLAPLVQQLIWITAGTRDTHDDLHGHVNTWAGHEDYVMEFRHDFFLSVDAMPNLHTFASELGPLDLDPARDEIDGLVYILWPAMCRPQSRITSFRYQDPLNYMRWLMYECKQADGGQPTELPTSFPVRALRVAAALFSEDDSSHLIHSGYRNFIASLTPSRSPMASRPSTMVWEEPLGKLLGLDLRVDSAGGDWKTVYMAEAMLRYFLTEAVNIRQLSLRFRPTGTYPRPTADSRWKLAGILPCRWKFLHTIKITFVNLSSPKFFIDFMGNHAKTLKHILLHQCSDNEDIVGIIRGAAKTKNLKLHRFLVFPSYEENTEARRFLIPPSCKGYEPRIIPERLVLDFINNKDPALDPFNEWMPSRTCNWGTVAHRAASVVEEWPKDDGMHFTCRQCSDQV